MFSTAEENAKVYERYPWEVYISGNTQLRHPMAEAIKFVCRGIILCSDYILGLIQGVSRDGGEKNNVTYSQD